MNVFAIMGFGLLILAAAKVVIVGGSCFPHKSLHLASWAGNIPTRPYAH